MIRLKGKTKHPITGEKAGIIEKRKK